LLCCLFYFSYTKPRGRVPDYDAPVVVPSEKCSIAEFCMRIHRSLLEQFKHALVWGTSVKHGQSINGFQSHTSDYRLFCREPASLQTVNYLLAGTGLLAQPKILALSIIACMEHCLPSML
jgi:hypothetical protein